MGSLRISITAKMEVISMPGTRESFCNKISYYFKNFPYSTVKNFSIACIGSISMAKYSAASFANQDPRALDLATLPPQTAAASIFGASCSLLAGTALCMYFLKSANKTIHDETQLLLQRKNIKRFLTEASMAFLAAITGASVSGGSFSDDTLRWTARSVGFIMMFSFNFAGMYNLIIKLTDKDYAFKQHIIEHLKQINPKYKTELEQMLAGQTLTAETLQALLLKIFDLAQSLKNETHDSLFIAPARTAAQQKYCFKITDTVLAVAFTAFSSFSYIQNGFSGTNDIFFNNRLQTLPDPAKIVIGTIIASPSLLFFFFGIKVFTSPILQLGDELTKDSRSMLKALCIATLIAGHSMWSRGLATMIAHDENIFSFILDNPFGQQVFPWAAYLSGLVFGFNNIFSFFFDPKINTENPQLIDAVRSVERQPAHQLQSLQHHSFFTAQNPHESKIIANSRSNSTVIEITDFNENEPAALELDRPASPSIIR
jgi:hypothetical protein